MKTKAETLRIANAITAKYVFPVLASADVEELLNEDPKSPLLAEIKKAALRSNVEMFDDLLVLSRNPEEDFSDVSELLERTNREMTEAFCNKVLQYYHREFESRIPENIRELINEFANMPYSALLGVFLNKEQNNHDYSDAEMFGDGPRSFPIRYSVEMYETMMEYLDLGDGSAPEPTALNEFYEQADPETREEFIIVACSTLRKSTNKLIVAHYDDRT